MVKLKYEYVIIGSPWEFYKRAYSDVIKLDNVKYLPQPFTNPILSKLYNFHVNPKINSFIWLPGKHLWNNLFLKDLGNSKPLCFIVFYHWFIQNTGIIESIKKKYPKARIVIIFNDLISDKVMFYSRKPLDIEELKHQVDLIITFDIKEAEKYNIDYHAIPYSSPLPIETMPKIKYDIYFLGQAKNRLKEIFDTYHSLIDAGLRVKFILANVPEEERKELPGIIYVDGLGISYEENISLLRQSRCLLEIMQKNGSGFTSRTLEAIAYDKQLLTNNNYIREAPFYNPEYISVFTHPTDIDLTFIKKIKSGEKVDYHYKENLSPVRLLEFIEAQLAN